MHLLLESNCIHTTAVKATDAFNYWPTECLHVWLFHGTPETSKEHIPSRTPTLKKLKSDRLHMGMHIKAVFSFTCTWFK